MKIRTILEAMSEAYGVTVAELMGESRSQPLVTYRQMAYWLGARQVGLSLSRIGRIIGKRHHTTVLYGVRVVEHRRRYKAFAAELDRIWQMACERHAKEAQTALVGLERVLVGVGLPEDRQSA